MRSVSPILFILLLSALFLSVQPVSGADGYLYEESISSYTRIDGETFRWNLEREFLIIDYEPINQNESRFMQITMQDNSQNGRIETVLEPLKTINFQITTELNEDGTPIFYSWEMFLFRDVANESFVFAPLDRDIRSAYGRVEQRVFDLDSEKLFFSVNLQHFEYDISNDKTDRIKVNTELATNNEKDGRIKKTAIHVKKVDANDRTLFEYHHEIQEKSTIQRYLNYLDQPALFVPLQIGAVLLAIYLYIRIHRYWTENEIKIIKSKKKDKIDAIDNQSSVESIEKDQLEKTE